MQVDVTAEVGQGLSSHFARVSTEVYVSEVGSVYKAEDLLPEHLDAIQQRMTDALAEIADKIHAEVERYRPAALARKERLAHEAVAAGSDG